MIEYQVVYVTFASLSAALCAYMFGWRATWAMLFAWGNEDKEDARLGRATIFGFDESGLCVRDAILLVD